MNKSTPQNSPRSYMLTIVSILIGLVAVTLHFIPKTNKVVFIDAQRLVNGYAGMADAKKSYEQTVSVWKGKLDTLRTEAEIKIKEYEATVSKLSPKEKVFLEQLIASKQEQFENYQQVVSEKVKTADTELTANVLGKVNDYIKKYGKDQGYQIIMAATQYGNIVYSDNASDITDEVLTGLNAEYNHAH